MEPTMSLKIRRLAVVGVGIASVGLFLSAADDPKKPAVKGVVQNAAVPKTPVDGAAAVAKPFGKTAPEGKMKLKEILAVIEDQTGLIVRVDQAALRNLLTLTAGEAEADEVVRQRISAISDTSVALPRQVDRIPMRDVLTDALSATAERPWTYQIRGSQLVILPAYLVPGQPGQSLIYPSLNPDEPPPEPFLPQGFRDSQIYGLTVRLTMQQQPLAEVLTELRKQTGANIMLDPRYMDQLKEKKPLLDVALADVRLFDALRVVADMAGLKMVYAGNVYYITTVANAKSFEPGSAYEPPPKKAPAATPPCAPAPTPAQPVAPKT
jgi:hypothetical protein